MLEAMGAQLGSHLIRCAEECVHSAFSWSCTLGHVVGAGQATGPLLYVNLELGKDQMIEVKCGYREAVVEALKR